MRFIAVAALMVLFASCGDDDANNVGPADQVKQCVADGGHAVFTSDKYGYVTFFLGCERIPQDPVAP